MKLWHDDVRPAPEGWVWARTNAEAMHLLRQRSEPDGQMVVTVCSLDHDLGLHDVEVPDPKVDPDGFLDAVSRKGHGQETGYDLVNWMVENDAVPDVVMIHSWNPDGAKAMLHRLQRFGHSATYVPFLTPGWKAVMKQWSNA